MRRGKESRGDKRRGGEDRERWERKRDEWRLQ